MYFLFIVISAVLFIGAFRLMSQGWTAMEEPTPPKKFNAHPEMEEVQHGDELLVVNFNRPIAPRDPLYQALQDRVESGPMIDDPWIDEDDEGDGDVPAIVKR